MIFVDATVPIALVGTDPRRKADAQLLLERAIAAGERLVTDSAVLQEILVRCTAVECCDAIEPAFDALLAVVDEVLSVEPEDVVRGKEMSYGPERLDVHTCLHLAVMERHGVRRIMSFTTGFDRYPEMTRLSGR